MNTTKRARKILALVTALALVFGMLGGTAPHAHAAQECEHAYASITVAATCGADGSVTYICTECGDRYTETIAATGEHSYQSITIEPSCVEEGAVTYICTVCGDAFTQVLEATGIHTYETETVEAGCLEDGSVTHTCTVCGDTYTEVLSATGHTFVLFHMDARCEVDGFHSYVCADCGYTIAETLPATGHSYSVGEYYGRVIYTCDACGDCYAEDGKPIRSYEKVSAFTAGEPFVVVVSDNGSYYALSHAGGAVSAVEVTVTDGVITSQVTEDMEWTYTADKKLSYTSGDETWYLTYTGTGNVRDLVVSSTKSTSVSFNGTKLRLSNCYLRWSGDTIVLNRYSYSSCLIFQGYEV